MAKKQLSHLGYQRQTKNQKQNSVSNGTSSEEYFMQKKIN